MTRCEGVVEDLYQRIYVENSVGVERGCSFWFRVSKESSWFKMKAVRFSGDDHLLN